MRKDSKGFFWEDTDYKTEKKETLLREEGWVQVFPGFWAEEYKLQQVEDPRLVCTPIETAYKLAKASRTGEKRIPPEPVWLADDYLPGLAEAEAFDIELLTDDELIDLALEVYTVGKKHILLFDIECYENYFLIAFMSLTLGKVVYFEINEISELDCRKLRWVFDNFCVIGFNSAKYDIYISAMAIEGYSTLALKEATRSIIEYNERGWELLKYYKVKQLKCDHIDLIEVAPLFASLKIYGGRMHSQRMQDLPFPPDAVLSKPQQTILRWYCINDLRLTGELYEELIKEIELRQEMGQKYNIDLRSKSDAQIAEAVIGNEIKNLNGYKPKAPQIDPGTSYYYSVPQFLKYQTPLMNGVLNEVKSAQFIVSEYGNIGLPQQLKDLSIQINETTYKMGIGGLHSNEKSKAHYADENTKLKDIDVTSYYPYIILNLGLYPKHLGRNFLTVFNNIVETRVAAKRAGNKTVADSLKIVVNGTFGKMGNQFSLLYSPDLLIQVTVTGQLSLLMLIERLELAGIQVVSANTDGIVAKYNNQHEPLLNNIINQWEKDTGFNTEETFYAALFSRDVNNYIAVKSPDTWKEKDTLNDKVKTKGIFTDPGLSKNPQNSICIEAIKRLFIEGKDIRDTIRNEKDIRMFLNVRTVKGGAVKTEQGKDGIYLGKAIRWYYGQNIPGEIVYAKSGNKVPKSEGAVPIMDLPSEFPNDIDYERYEKETLKILKHIDYLRSDT